MAADAKGVSARAIRIGLSRRKADDPLRRTIKVAAQPLSIALAAIALYGLAATWTARPSPVGSDFAKAASGLDIVASLAAHESHGIIGHETPTREHLDRLEASLPQLSLSDGRTVYLADQSGIVVASTEEASGRTPRRLSDLFVDIDAAHAADGGVFPTVLRDGTPAIATVRALPSGHLALVQPRREAGPAPLWAPGDGATFAVMLAAGLAGLGASLLHRRRTRLAGSTGSRLTRRLDTSLARGRCGLWDWDATRGRIYWSSSMYEVLGYEARGEYLTGAEVAAILEAEDGCLRTLLDACAATGCGQFEREVRARNASGQWLWFLVKGQAVRDEVDGSLHVVGFATDITGERRQAERRAQNEVRLRDAVEAISEAFVLWDSDDRLILCNSKFLALNGVPPEAASPGTAALDILAAGSKPITARQVAGSDSLDPAQRTFETQLSDGRWLRVNERRTRDGGVVSIGTDVSEAKWKEARMRAREQRLKGSVRAAETEAQRFAAIAERNYEANLAKTEFMARMSHELRTPLNAIIGFSDLMRQEIMGPLGCLRYTEYTTDIHASGLRLLDTIDAILQMSRIETGQLQLVPEPMRIETTLREVLDTVAEEYPERAALIQVDVVPTTATLQADASALRETLLHLVRNALRYSVDDDPIRIRVRPAGRCLNVFVEDGGLGIPAEIVPRLGRPFEQVEAEYSRSGGGSGLGLAIARGLTEMHGGRLRIRSQVGIGTVVLVHLPLAQPAANDAAPFGALRPYLAAAE